MFIVSIRFADLDASFDNVFEKEEYGSVKLP